MKKFKKGDTIAKRDDQVSERTFQVLSGSDDQLIGPTAIRNDVSAFLALPFVLGRPEDYKLVKRPSKKDREIEQLQALVKESQDSYKRLQERAQAAEDANDRQLLEAGLVRSGLLRANAIHANWSGDTSSIRTEVVFDARNRVVRDILRAITI